MKPTPFRISIIFWLCYFLFEWLYFAAYDNEYVTHLIMALAYTPVMMAASWVTHVIKTKYFFSGKRSRFWLYLIASAVFFTFLNRAISYYGLYPLFSDPMRTKPYLYPPKMIFELLNVYLVVALNSLIYFTRAWYEQQRLAESLQKDKVEAQLELLKSQVQPHFIFNTLNNIYSLSTQQSEKTPDLIYRLSSLLSYMLYDSKETTIPLSREIEYIANYIELEKIRYGSRLDISLNVLTDINEIRIPPFLMLPLVENSFKHGASHAIDTCWIRIDILVIDDVLSIKVENSKTVNGQLPAARGGIGLENVKKRLEYIYPRRHEFKCIDEEQTYLVTLKIKGSPDENKMPAGG